jgi:hypothetical protein
MYIELVAVMGDEIEGRLHMRSALPNDTVGKSLGKAITGRSCKRLFSFLLWLLAPEIYRVLGWHEGSAGSRKV